MRKQVAIRIQESIIEKVRDIAYWSPGMTQSSFFEEALQSQIGEYERAKGSTYPSRKSHKVGKIT